MKKSKDKLLTKTSDDKPRELPKEYSPQKSNISAYNPGQSSGNVSVISRFRPLNDKEKSISIDMCVDFVDSERCVVRSNYENNNYKFNFDRIFSPESSQQEVYDFAARPIVDSVLEGFNGTILAYGQTSSGKTFTMEGSFDDEGKYGVIPRMVHHMFDHIMSSPVEVEYTVKVSMLEIYMEKVRDLIDTDQFNLNIREDKTKGIYIEQLSEHYVGSEDEVLELMQIGSENRAQASTNMNEHSSRSHSLFIITIHQVNNKDFNAKTGKLYLVDLAGSEKISKTGATGLTLEEAKTINKSLHTLGMVINSLTDGRSTHIPYRESKLTRILQESLGGNSKTCLIITCSPSVYNESETLSTLRFGNRAKNIKNKPKINKEITTKELQLVIEKLEKELHWAKRRINMLESYIQINNLKVPKDEEGEFYGYSAKVETKTSASQDHSFIQAEDSNVKTRGSVDLNSSIGMVDDYNREAVKSYRNALEKDISKLTKEDLIEANRNFNLMTNQLKEERAINSKQLTELTDYRKMNELMEQSIMDYKEREKEMEDRIIQLEAANRQLEKKSQSGKTIPSTSPIQQANENTASTYEISQQRNKLPNIPANPIQTEPKKTEFNKSSLIQSHQAEFQTPQTKIKCTALALTEMVEDMIKTASESTNSEVQKLREMLESCKERVYIDKINIFEENFLPKTEYDVIRYNQKMIEEAEQMLKKDKKRYENEKRFILRLLEEKSERIAQLEIELKENSNSIKILENKVNPEDRQFAKKIVNLEKNLDQLNSMYQQIVTAKGVVKCENQVLLRKMKQKNDKISQLERECQELRETVMKLI